MIESVLKRVLRAVFGGGSDISAANPLEVHDPKVGSLISYEGTTTSDGADDGSTLIDSVLTTKPDYDGNQVIITSGDYAGQAKDINGATNNVTGTVTPHTAFGGKIVEGVTFVIAAIRTVPAEVAALETKLDRLAGAEDAGTHAHTSNTNWQEVVEVTTTARKKLLGIWLDFNLLAQNMNMRMSCKIDGATYRIFWTDTWLSTDEDGALIATPWAFNNDIKLELQSAVAEGASKNIPYKLIYQDMQ